MHALGYYLGGPNACSNILFKMVSTVLKLLHFSLLCECYPLSTEVEAYRSYYSEADYPVTKLLKDPVYAEVHILGRTDSNLVLNLDYCWATSTPSPLSLPKWDLLVDG